ncbi:AraC family transcriptional regulator [uncultured Endozoicomonas sp.]|uniref:AraC family transcriptional regulator n=1 Tax=uncultured Endozoicomonas sp. TaxID=432652 RepID=UPI0026033E66|nr:AraC family transcriptional regulator [uncultured Endozoicomonas sp.]
MTSSSTLGTVSANAIRQYLRTAQDYDIQAESALLAASIPVGILDNSVTRVQGRAFQTLIHWLVKETGDPLFGLKSARYVQPGSYNLLGYMAMNAHSVGEILKLAPEYEAIVGDMGITDIQQKDGLMIMRWICQYDDPVVRPHMIDNVMGSWLIFSQWLTDLPDKKPESVLFEYPQPDDRLIQTYREIFGDNLTFNAGKNALLFSEDVLDIPLRQPDPILLNTLEQQASTFVAELQQDKPIVVQTRELLRSLMEDGIPRREKVAEKLNITERTLQRRLQEAGAGYQQLLDDLRQETAIEWLASTELPSGEIAEKLGFSEVRSFHRKFKSWTDLTPGEYRQKHSHLKKGRTD